MPASLPSVESFISFRLDQLSSQNAHHEFEQICARIAQGRISSTILLASGPVSAAGDQGRDAESFFTAFSNESGATEPVVVAATTQRKGLRRKVLDDLDAICADGAAKVDRVAYFSVAPIASGLVHELQMTARETHAVSLDVFSGSQIATLLAASDLLWIARHYLDVPDVLVEGIDAEPAAERAQREIDASQAETAALLQRLPPNYPSHLRLLGLANDLHLVEIADLKQLDEFSRGDSLYSSFRPWQSTRQALTALRREKSGIVLGNPGSGKSTILAAHCVETIERGREIVVFARLEEVGRVASGMSIHGREDALTAVVIAWNLWRGIDRDDTAAREQARVLGTARRLVFALDGLDEISTPAFREAAIEVAGRIREGRARVIVCSRVTGYVKPWTDSREHFVAPLGSRVPKAFARRWFPEGGIQLQSALQALRNDTLADAARIPLIAGFICVVAEHEQVATSVPGLYRQYLSNVLSRQWKSVKRRVESSQEFADAFLAARDCAWQMATSSSPAPRRSPWKDVASLDWLISRTSSAPAVMRLYEEDGLLVSYGLAPRADPRGQEVRWLHRTLHEHLVGRVIADIVNRDEREGLRWLLEGALRPQWSVALEHAIFFINEDGNAERCFDAILQSGLDTREGKIANLALALAAKGHPSLAARASDLAASRRALWYLERMDPDRLMVEVEADMDAGLTARRAEEIGRVLATADVPSTWWDRLEPWSAGYQVQRLMVQSDPIRAVDRMIEEVAAPTGHWSVWHNVALRHATSAQRESIAQGVSRALDSGDPRVEKWLDLVRALAPRYRAEITERAIHGRRIESIAGENIRGGRRGAPDRTRMTKSDLADVATGGFGEAMAFSLGWAEGEAPQVADMHGSGWFELGRRAAQIDWSAEPENLLFTEGEAARILGRFRLDRLHDATFASDWIEALRTLRARPTVALYSALIGANLEATDQEVYLNSPLQLDSSWWTSFKNSIQWQIREQAIQSALAVADPKTDVARWLYIESFELLDAASEAGDSRHAEMFSQLVSALPAYWRPDDPKDLQLGYFRLSKDTAAATRQVHELLEVASVSGDHGLISAASIWAEDRLFDLDALTIIGQIAVPLVGADPL